MSAGAGKTLPSDAQWEAVRETKRHMLVSAGAGTGKTFTVVSHILYLMGVDIRDSTHAPALELNEIAAITYTNKAAAELKGKLRDRLREAGRRDDAYRVDSARVGTIHGFCGDILHEFALRGALPPGLVLLDETESRVLRAECVREVLLRALEAPAASADVIDGLIELLGKYSVQDVEKWTGELLAHGDHLREIVSRAHALAPRERALVSLADQSEALFTSRLRERGAMDFDRMITWTRDLIRDDAAVRCTLQRRIRVLIIDEYQDVDPVQREIAYLLGAPESDAPDTTRLMLVGDPKQSIYSFRKADVRGWKLVEDDFRTKGRGIVVEIADSRRSVPAVLGFVDHAIGALLDEPIGESDVLRDFEVAYSPVLPVRADESPEPAVEFLCVPQKEDGCTHSAAVIRDSEAHAVALRAVELHESGVRWSGMAVLLSSWTDLDRYQLALEALHIPTYALRNEGFYEQREILDLIVALEAVRNPVDDRALLGFLRSPFIGVTDETLLRIATQLPSPVWPQLRKGSALALPDEDERGRLSTAIALIEHLSSLRDRISNAELLDELLQETGYLAHLLLMGEPGKQAIANVRKFLSVAGSSSDVSLGSFLDTVEGAREQKIKEGSARLYGENDDVLTITSIHSAKGLEWKVIFWCDLQRGARNSASSLLVSGARVSLGGGDEGDEQDDDAEIVDVVIDDERVQLLSVLADEKKAEAKRLWYVAATRAEDRLVVCVPAGTTKKSRDEARRRAKAGEPPDRNFKSAAEAMKRIFPSLGQASAERYRARDGREFDAHVRMVAVIDTQAVATPVRMPLDPAILAAPPVPIQVAVGRSRHSATELLSLERCGRRHWFKYVAGIREPDIPPGEKVGEINAITRGLIVHDVLERMRELEELDRLLEDAVGRHDPNAPFPELPAGAHYRDAIRAELHAVLQMPEYRAVFDAPDSRRELGFLHIVDADTYIEGKIDLIAAVDGGYRVIDVKTSHGDAAAAQLKAAQYAIQKAVYVNAVEAISGAAVSDFGFQFSAIATQVGGLLSEGERVALDERLGGALKELAVESPALAKNANDCRYCGYRAVGWCPGVAELAISTLTSE